MCKFAIYSVPPEDPQRYFAVHCNSGTRRLVVDSQMICTHTDFSVAAFRSYVVPACPCCRKILRAVTPSISYRNPCPYQRVCYTWGEARRVGLHSAPLLTRPPPRPALVRFTAYLRGDSSEVLLERLKAQALVPDIHKHIVAAVECTKRHFGLELVLHGQRHILQHLLSRCRSKRA